ncbi:MAG: DUF4783 domain-containing protein [Vicingaceae bacterium]
MRLFLVLLSFSFTLSTFAQKQSEIGKQLETGNAEKLTSFFKENVELEIPGSKGLFNKKQASIVLDDFFSKNPPNKYFQKHNGGGNNKALFEIGSLLSKDKKYRTYLLYNLVDNTPQIIELRIELEE